MRQPSRARLKILRRIFRVEPHLNGTARWPNRHLSQSRQLARRLPHHPLHQIDARDFFGDAVLHLQPRVHFQEIELRRYRCRRRTPPCRPTDTAPPRPAAPPPRTVARATPAQVPAPASPRSPSDCAAAPSNRVRPARPRRPRRRRRSALRCAAPARRTSPDTAPLVPKLAWLSRSTASNASHQFCRRRGTAACRCRRRPPCSSASPDSRCAAAASRASSSDRQQSRARQQRHAVLCRDLPAPCASGRRRASAPASAR